MGMFFNNIHIRKNEAYSFDKLRELLIGEMESKGYTLLESGEEPDMSVVIYSPDNSEWVSVASDSYNFNTPEDTKAVAFPISEKFGTDVLAAACCDSDYLLMNLINAADGTDGWVNVGSLYGMKLPRRTSIAPWRGKVTDFEKFKAVIKEKNVFAEDAFYCSAKLLGMVTEQCALETNHADEFEEGYLTRLNFSLPDSVQKEPPKLTISFFDVSPCKIGKSRCVLVNNKGGGSKGIGITFVGDFIENDLLTFENVTFESDFGSGERKITPITLEKVKAHNGKTILYWQDESFNIPSAVNSSIPMSRQMDLESKRRFGVRFTIQGDPRKVLDVKVFIFPLENKQEGAACWYVYKLNKTKERYIEWYNEQCQNNPNYALNPNDYDL